MDTVVVSTQHAADVSLEQIRADMIELVIKPTIPAELFDENTRILVNPTGPSSAVSETEPVPKVSMRTDTGRATPMA